MNLEEILRLLERIISTPGFLQGLLVGAIFSGALVYWLTKISREAQKEAIDAKKETLEEYKSSKSKLETDISAIQKEVLNLEKEQKLLREIFSLEHSNKTLFQNSYFNLNILIQMEQYLNFLHHFCFCFNLLKHWVPEGKEIPNVEPTFWEIRKIQDKIKEETNKIYDFVLESSTSSEIEHKVEDRTAYYKEEIYDKLVEIQDSMDPIIFEVVIGPIYEYLKQEGIEDPNRIRPPFKSF